MREHDSPGNRQWQDAESPTVRTTYASNELNQYTYALREDGPWGVPAFFLAE